jgi:hypothetical protein
MRIVHKLGPLNETEQAELENLCYCLQETVIHLSSIIETLRETLNKREI